jgi:hypothetical protein
VTSVGAARSNSLVERMAQSGRPGAGFSGGGAFTASRTADLPRHFGAGAGAAGLAGAAGAATGAVAGTTEL